MDAYKLLTEKLTENGRPFLVDLICQPSDAQMQDLKEGSGNPDAEMRQINSSAGLAVNYWLAYELCHKGSSVEFEWQKQRPLKYGRPANIDVVLNEQNTIAFIESKFLEPYYSGNEIPRDAYLDASKYARITPGSPQLWVDLFSEVNEFKYYNVTQLCRHLLAISKEMLKRPKFYEGKKVKLWSVTWDMPDSFIESFPDEIGKAFELRRSIIRKEAKKCEILLNRFISEHLGIEGLCFEKINYNDIINLLEGSEYYIKIKEQYFL